MERRPASLRSVFYFLFKKNYSKIFNSFPRLTAGTELSYIQKKNANLYVGMHVNAPNIRNVSRKNKRYF